MTVRVNYNKWKNQQNILSQHLESSQDLLYLTQHSLFFHHSRSYTPIEHLSKTLSTTKEKHNKVS